MGKRVGVTRELQNPLEYSRNFPVSGDIARFVVQRKQRSHTAG